MRPGESTVYCIDTSSLINLHRWRPEREHVKVWGRLEDLIEKHRLLAPKKVLGELHRKSDVLPRWARGHKRMFKSISAESVATLQQILKKFPGLVDQNRPDEVADPYVVALARQESRNTLGDEVVVVTDEKYAPGRPRIPHVCEAYRLKYLTIHQVFLFEGWDF